MNTKEIFTHHIHQLQDQICRELEQIDGRAKFFQDEWIRPEGGGGKTRVIENGAVFEKGGVNTSAVYGALPAAMQQAFGVQDSNFFACGLSLVIHPLNPYVPTVHANWRYFELYDNEGEKKDNWFGGGADLTPYYLDPKDGIHFHRTLKAAIQPFGSELHPLFKKNCDEYFSNKHRNNEMRGIGGVFYDYLRPGAHGMDEATLIVFQKANGQAFLDAYLPIVRSQMNAPYTDREVIWQEMRRGRYVEFNLIHDRGTLFGLKTNGRTESILMSLPPRARWQYNFSPKDGSAEADMMQYYFPKEWA